MKGLTKVAWKLAIVGVFLFTVRIVQSNPPPNPPSSVTPQSLAVATLFDGSSYPSWQDVDRRSVATVDSQDNAIVVTRHSNGLCRVNSISKNGILNWQKPSGADYLPCYDYWAQGVTGPNDEVFLALGNFIVGYRADGSSLPGFPVELGATFVFTVENALILAQDKTRLFARLQDQGTYRIAAIGLDGAIIWTRDYALGNTANLDGPGLVQGMQGDIFNGVGPRENRRFIRLDDETGAELCNRQTGDLEHTIQGAKLVYSGDQVFGQIDVPNQPDHIFAYDGNCNGSQFFDSSPIGGLWDIESASGKLFFRYGGSVAAISAITSQILWTNSSMNPSIFRAPIVSATPTSLYVLGDDRSDNLILKLFLLDADTGATQGAVSLAQYCGDELACGFVLAADGSIYMNGDLNTPPTKIYRIIGSPIPNQAPTGGFTMTGGSQSATEGQTLNITAPTAPVFVSFLANRSSDADGTVTGWEWRIDGATVSNLSTFTYGLSIGTHTVGLIVTDNQGAPSQMVTGQIVITLPVPLKLFFSNDGDPNHPLDISYKYVKRTDKYVLADVTLTNRTGTWFQLTPDFNTPSPGVSFSVSDNQIPFAFLIGPFGQVVFRTTFYEGHYLHFNATRLSTAAISMLGIDLIGRGLFGVELSNSWQKSYVDLSLAFIKELLSNIKTGCAGDSINVGFGIVSCDGPFRIVCILEKLAKFLKCTVENPQLRKAIKDTITHFFGTAAAKKWIEFGAKSIGEIFIILDNVPKLVELIYYTTSANTEGFARLEARR